jgi:hypothetical protein
MLMRKLKHSNYSITKFLEAHGIEHQIVQDDPDWIVVHPMFGNYLVHDKAILETLSQDNLQRLKSGKSSLLFWYPYETEHYGHPNVRRQIEGCLDTVGGTSDRVFLVTGNLNAPFKPYPMKLVDAWYKNMNTVFYDYVAKISPEFHSEIQKCIHRNRLVENVTLNELKKLPFPKDFALHKVQDLLTRDSLIEVREPVKSIPLLWFDWQLTDFLQGREELDQLQNSDSYKDDKKKAYMCLNGKDKHTRRYLLDRLPMEHGHVSYVCYDGVDRHIRGSRSVPIILDQEKHSIKRNDRWLNPEIYHDAYINVVTEAFPDKETDCFITEKTFKPMLQLQPFMIQGNRHTLKRLREYGFHTFPELWDESYDELETWQERTDAMLKQLHSFCTLSTHDQLAKCKQVWWSLLHNQEMVLKTSTDVTKSAHLADILRAFSSGG